jgi:hypothetical protein
MKNIRVLTVSLVAAVFLFMPVFSQSAPNMEGTYTSGMVTLDLKSGGKAMLTMMGESMPCVYKTTNDRCCSIAPPKGRRWTSSSTATGRFPVQASSGT